MEMELSADRLVPALLGFNVGVEIGQLAFVFALWPVLFLLGRWRQSWRLGLAEAVSAFVLATGLYWVMVRSA